MPVITARPPSCSTGATKKVLSREELLTWINEMQQVNDLKVIKIEDLCTGNSYCHLVERLFPGKVRLKRLKSNPQLEHEFIHNWKILQVAFTEIGITKEIPIESIVKNRFQDNFKFLQWFKSFYDITLESRVNPDGEFKWKKQFCGLDLSPIGNQNSPIVTSEFFPDGNNIVSSTPLPGPSEVPNPDEMKSNSPQTSHLDSLRAEHECYNEKIKNMTKMRDFYLNKVREIEKLTQTHEKDPEHEKFLSIIRKKIFGMREN